MAGCKMLPDIEILLHMIKFHMIMLHICAHNLNVPSIPHAPIPPLLPPAPPPFT